MGRHSHHRRHDDESDDEDKHKKRKERERGDGYDDDERRRTSSHQRRREFEEEDDDDDSTDSRDKKKKRSRSRKERTDDRKRRKHSHKSRHGDDNDGSTASDKDRHRHKKSDRKEKKSSSKHHRRHRDDSSSDDERKKKKKSKHSSKHEKKTKESSKVDKTSLHPMGDPVGHPPSTLIDAEQDYFSYHQEFWIYLFREEGIAFNDLDTKQAKKAFARFAKRYNKGDLEEPYYSRKFPAQVLEESKTSKHSWGFNTSEKERQSLELLQAGVRQQTEYDKDSGPQVAPLASRTSGGHGTGLAGEDDTDQRRRKTPEERLEERHANKRLKESVRTAREEISGGAKDFRERQLEKKRDHAARIHGASKDKEDGGAGVELSDSALFGDDERASFQSALARERNNRLQREQKKQARVEELQAKEDERQKNMLKMLGLDKLQGQKIKIAPRKDV
jgi:hypothetical protein